MVQRFYPILESYVALHCKAPFNFELIFVYALKLRSSFIIFFLCFSSTISSIKLLLQCYQNWEYLCGPIIFSSSFMDHSLVVAKGLA